MTSDHNQNPADKWGSCPLGELTDMVERTRIVRSRQKIARVVFVATLLLLGASLSLVVPSLLRSQQPPGAEFGYLACSEVLLMLEDFAQGRLSADLKQRVSIHLDHCPSCKKRYEAIAKPDVSQAVPLENLENRQPEEDAQLASIE